MNDDLDLLDEVVDSIRFKSEKEKVSDALDKLIEFNFIPKEK